MHFIYIAGLTAGLVGALAWMISRQKPRRLEGAAGTIAPERLTAIFTVLAGLALAVIGGVALVAGNWIVGFGSLLMGLACAAFMAPSLTDLHSVHWSSEGVEGPSRLFGPTLGLNRTSINWAEITSTGETITGYWFVQAADGRRIYWSYLYSGYGAFVSNLAARCPNVVLPMDLRT